MMVTLLIAGIGFLLAGLLAVSFGIPVKEFSFGNTLILTGVLGACTGTIMLALWMVVRELKNIARRLGPGVVTESYTGATLQRDQAPEGGFLFGRDQRAAENAVGHAAQSSAPWYEDASRDRMRDDQPAAAAPVEAAPAVKGRRNLLFSSSLRKEREPAQGRTSDPSAADLRAARTPAPSSPSSEAPPATFDDAWPKSERSGSPLRRSNRAPSTFTEPSADTPVADRLPSGSRDQDQPPVTVLKSGVVDGMAYSLYSDGSIEAQMPEGMMRFASIDELRSHLDQRS
jgi:hypothetical protein